MKDKRFKKVQHIYELNDEGVKDNNTRIEYYYAVDLLDLLNNQEETIKELEKDVEYLDGELKEANWLYDNLDESLDVYRSECSRLEKEYNTLKKQIKVNEGIESLINKKLRIAEKGLNMTGDSWYSGQIDALKELKKDLEL